MDARQKPISQSHQYYRKGVSEAPWTIQWRKLPSWRPRAPLVSDYTSGAHCHVLPLRSWTRSTSRTMPIPESATIHAINKRQLHHSHDHRTVIPSERLYHPAADVTSKDHSNACYRHEQGRNDLDRRIPLILIRTHPDGRGETWRVKVCMRVGFLNQENLQGGHRVDRERSVPQGQF